jgi:hypothetical protein
VTQRFRHFRDGHTTTRLAHFSPHLHSHTQSPIPYLGVRFLNPNCLFPNMYPKYTPVWERRTSHIHSAWTKLFYTSTLLSPRSPFSISRPPSHFIGTSNELETMEPPNSASESAGAGTSGGHAKGQAEDARGCDIEGNVELLALPSPEDRLKPLTLNVATGESVALDHLGPVIVTTAGGLERITNWAQLSEGEQQVCGSTSREPLTDYYWQ